jgi:hypothetical protein
MIRQSGRWLMSTGHYGKAGRPVHPVSLPKWEACRSAATVRANTEIGGGGNISAVCLSLLPLTVPFGSYYSGEPPTGVLINPQISPKHLGGEFTREKKRGGEGN